MAFLDHLGDRELKKLHVNGASIRKDGVVHTPWRLLNLFLARIYWLLESLDTSGEQA